MNPVISTAAIAQHLNIAADAVITVEKWAQVLWVRFVGGCRFVSKKVIKMTTITMTEKQQKAWQRQHQYLDRYGIYKVTIENGRCFGHFNSSCGEYVSRFDFAYDSEKGGEIGILGDNGGDTWNVPCLVHPNELYNWLRDFFGYEKSTFIRW